VHQHEAACSLISCHICHPRRVVSSEAVLFLSMQSCASVIRSHTNCDWGMATRQGVGRGQGCARCGGRGRGDYGGVRCPGRQAVVFKQIPIQVLNCLTTRDSQLAAFQQGQKKEGQKQATTAKPPPPPQHAFVKAGLGILQQLGEACGMREAGRYSAELLVTCLECTRPSVIAHPTLARTRNHSLPRPLGEVPAGDPRRRRGVRRVRRVDPERRDGEALPHRPGTGPQQASHSKQATASKPQQSPQSLQSLQ
jgi:hypothetical protein